MAIYNVDSVWIGRNQYRWDGVVDVLVNMEIAHWAEADEWRNDIIPRMMIRGVNRIAWHREIDVRRREVQRAILEMMRALLKSCPQYDMTEMPDDLRSHIQVWSDREGAVSLRWDMVGLRSNQSTVMPIEWWTKSRHWRSAVYDMGQGSGVNALAEVIRLGIDRHSVRMIRYDNRFKELIVNAEAGNGYDRYLICTESVDGKAVAKAWCTDLEHLMAGKWIVFDFGTLGHR